MWKSGERTKAIRRMTQNDAAANVQMPATKKQITVTLSESCATLLQRWPATSLHK